MQLNLKNPFNPKIYYLWIVLAVLAFITAVNLTACSPQSRLNRIIKKNPELSINTNITITDTLYLPSTSVDTIFQDSPSDTVIVMDSLIKITYIKIKDKIYLKGETMRVPVIVTKEVMVKSPVVTKTVMVEHWYHKPLMWLSFILILIISAILLGKALKIWLNSVMP